MSAATRRIWPPALHARAWRRDRCLPTLRSAVAMTRYRRARACAGLSMPRQRWWRVWWEEELATRTGIPPVRLRYRLLRLEAH